MLAVYRFARKRNTRGIPVESDTRNKLRFYECSSLLSFDLSTRSPMKSCLITNVAAKNKGPNEAKDGDDHTRSPFTISRIFRYTPYASINGEKKEIAIESSSSIPWNDMHGFSWPLRRQINVSVTGGPWYATIFVRSVISRVVHIFQLTLSEW